MPFTPKQIDAMNASVPILDYLDRTSQEYGFGVNGRQPKDDLEDLMANDRAACTQQTIEYNGSKLEVITMTTAASMDAASPLRRREYNLPPGKESRSYSKLQVVRAGTIMMRAEGATGMESHHAFRVKQQGGIAAGLGLLVASTEVFTRTHETVFGKLRLPRLIERWLPQIVVDSLEPLEGHRILNAAEAIKLLPILQQVELELSKRNQSA